MSLKTYVPSSIEAEVERVRENDSKVNPTYFTTSLTRPTALSRNLQDASVIFKEFDIPVAPLKLPDTHSTGNPQNSRAFDYDYLIANETDSTDLDHFFVIDLGSMSWSVKYIEGDGQSSFKFIIESSYENDPDVDLAFLSYKLLNTSNIVSTVTSQVDGTEPRLYALDYLKNNYDVYITIEDIDVSEGDATATVSYLNIETSYVLSEKELEDLKDINIITGFYSDYYESNIRFFNKLSYDETLRDYYIYNSTERFNSIKNYLVNNEVKPYPAYAGQVRSKEGLLFSVDLTYTDDQDFTEALTYLNMSLGRSVIATATSQHSLVGFSEVLFKVPEETDSTIVSVEILKAVFDDTEDPESFREVSLAVKTTDINPKSWYDFFKPYGLVAIPAVKKIVTTSVSYIDIPGEPTEEDENPSPVQQEVVTETVSYMLKGLFLRLVSNNEESDERLLVRFTTTEEGFATANSKSVLASFKETLENGRDAYIIHPSTESMDKLIKTYSIGYKHNSNQIDNGFSLGISNKEVAYTITVADATSLDVSNYATTNRIDVSFNKTPFFNKGYGIDSNLNKLKTAIELFSQTSTLRDPRYSYLLVNSLNPSINNIYVASTEKDTLLSTTAQSLRTGKEFLYHMDSTTARSHSFKNIVQLPYVIVDFYNLKALQINPFSYINDDGSLISEQDTVTLSYVAPTAFESAEEYSEHHTRVLSEFSSSLLSSYFLPIVPLYDAEDVFAECFAIFYDPCTVEGVTLKNVLSKITRAAVIDESFTLEFKYRSSIENAIPKYTNLTVAAGNTSEVDFNSYFEIKSSSVASLVGSSFEYSLNGSYNVTFEVSDILNRTLETLTFTDTETESSLEDYVDSLDSDYLNIEYTSNGIIHVALKSTLDDTRYVIKVSNVNGGAVVNSKLIQTLSETVTLIPLNRS